MNNFENLKVPPSNEKIEAIRKDADESLTMMLEGLTDEEWKALQASFAKSAETQKGPIA